MEQYKILEMKKTICIIMKLLPEFKVHFGTGLVYIEKNSRK